MNSDKQAWQRLVKDHIKNSEQPLIAVVGPTAAGKTAFSVELAMYIQADCAKQAEVLNADSRQLYRYMDIGTAKVTEEEMRGVPHHLFSVLNPDEELTVGWYKDKADNLITSLHARGAVPLLVGGSMLYISAITDGLTLGPPEDTEIRERLTREYDADNGAALYKQLQNVDPEIALTVHQNNKPRLIRAMEIIELREKQGIVPRTELRSPENTSAYDVLMLGISLPRDKLVVKINNRTSAMMQAGWIEEVKHLIDLGYTEESPAMKASGYKEIMRYLQHGEPASEAELIEMIAAKTRQYARRQMTWWKTDERIFWV